MARSSTKCWSTLENVLKHRAERVLTYGVPGTGKTHAGLYIGLVEGEKVYSVTLTPDTPASDLIGRFIVRPTQNGPEMLWLDGVAVRAFRDSHKGPVRLNVNEINHAGPDLISILHVICESAETAVLDLPNGEQVKPCAANYRVTASMNGDPVDDLIPSILDRFPILIEIDTIHPDAVKRLPAPWRTTAVNLATEEDESRRVSIRKWLGVTDLVKNGMPEADAFKAVFGDEMGVGLMESLRIAAGTTPKK